MWTVFNVNFNIFLLFVTIALMLLGQHGHPASKMSASKSLAMAINVSGTGTAQIWTWYSPKYPMGLESFGLSLRMLGIRLTRKCVYSLYLMRSTLILLHMICAARSRRFAGDVSCK